MDAFAEHNPPPEDEASSSHAGRILVHMCCGPCSVYPMKVMLQGRADVWGYFHNPNIHPYSEFKKRLEAVKRLSVLLSLDVILDEAYRPREFIKGARSFAGASSGVPAKGTRCLYCYATRLEETARTAKREGFDAFTTSLLYSRYQMHEGIRTAGEELGRRHGVPFIYADFRNGWVQGIEGSRSMGLYRQNYCGCIWSRIERAEEKRGKRPGKGATGA